MRKIKINKEDLIVKIEENRRAHIEEYLNAVKAFKVEALKQLKELTKKVTKGETEKITLDLVEPVNNEENYDKLLEMFEWEVDAIIELSHEEFQEYVQDETTTSFQASYSNSMYTSSN